MKRNRNNELNWTMTFILQNCRESVFGNPLLCELFQWKLKITHGLFHVCWNDASNVYRTQIRNVRFDMSLPSRLESFVQVWSFRVQSLKIDWNMNEKWRFYGLSRISDGLLDVQFHTVKCNDYSWTTVFLDTVACMGWGRLGGGSLYGGAHPITQLVFKDNHGWGGGGNQPHKNHCI